jgi:rhodanese-related sulfurtransferase
MSQAAIVDVHTLRARLQEAPDDVRILDVRTAGEFETVHIPGSYHVPLDTLAEHRDELRRLSEGTVLVCQSGHRAQQAARQLSALGVTGVEVLEGGIGAWVQAGAEARRGQERWSLERQVRLVAGSIVLGTILGSTAVPGLKWVAGFVGGGLTFAALSNTCAMGAVLARLPYNRGTAACDTGTVVRALVDRQPSPVSAA